MSEIQILNREMTPAEFDRMKTGFDEHTIDNGVLVQEADRYTYVAATDNQFVGCASGLAYKNGEAYSGWFYLTDLFVEAPFRGTGLGARLLAALEQRVTAVGVTQIWTWTAGYEAPGFYKKQGYTLFTEMEHWYSDGSSRVGFKKRLTTTKVRSGD